jgi:hypothetical protein
MLMQDKIYLFGGSKGANSNLEAQRNVSVGAYQSDGTIVWSNM